MKDIDLVKRKPDGGLAEWIEILEDGDDESDAVLLLLLLELRRHRQDKPALIEQLEAAQRERDELQLGFVANEEEAQEAIKYATEIKEQLVRVSSGLDAALVEIDEMQKSLDHTQRRRTIWRGRAEAAEAELKRRDAIFPPVYPDSDEMNRMTDIFNDTVKINYEDGFVDNPELVITAIVNHWEKIRRDAQDPVGETITPDLAHLSSPLPIRTKIYAAAPAVVLPPEMTLSDISALEFAVDDPYEFVAGANYMRILAMELGCQSEKVVKLPEPVGAFMHTRYVKQALDDAGVKWEGSK